MVLHFVYKQEDALLSTEEIVSSLKSELTSYKQYCMCLEEAIKALDPTFVETPKNVIQLPKRHMSAQTRHRMARAQRARWAKRRKIAA